MSGTSPARGGAVPDAARAALVGERDVLLASIEDLEREHAAGDVDDADYETLRAGYVARAADTLRALEALEGVGRAGEGGAGPGASTARAAGAPLARLRRLLGRRRARFVLGVVGACCALGLVGIAAAHLAGVRLPGQYASGSVSLPEAAKVRQQLQQASLLGSTGKVSAAVALYGTVLGEVPDQPEALTYRGWLVRLAGLADHRVAAVRAGDAELAKAVAVAPRYADARALYGVALLEDDGRLGLAVAQFGAFLRDRPGTQLLQALGPQMAAAFAAAHEAVPGALRPYHHGPVRPAGAQAGSAPPTAGQG